MKYSKSAALAALLSTTCASFAYADAHSAGQVVPEPPAFAARAEITFVDPATIQEFRALDSYSEPAWVTENFVDTGLLPPVAERLPAEPMVMLAGDMPDGIGEYGDTLRHVIGGRPEGWNWISGQAQGWGGISYQLWECLTRTGPLFRVNADQQQPLPNLATGWEWSDDGMQLTMNLIEGAKWSDGDPFDAEDIMYYWDYHVMDSNVAPQGGATPETFGVGTTLEMIDANTIRFTFTTERPEQVLYQMAFGTFCPGPSHVMAPMHPANNPDMSYEDYKNAFPADDLTFPVMGSHVPVIYRPDDVIVLRRNPYYWKVDEAGNQLPYYDETQYFLSTWADRTTQAISGSGDWSNMEEPGEYVAALQRAAEEDAPARLEFGPRIIGYTVDMNYGTTGWGDPDARASAVRELNRNLDFRLGVTMAVDRETMGQSLVRGPFTAIYPGGLYPDTIFYDRDSTVYYPFDAAKAAEHFAAAGLEDTDGNGILNLPDGGGDVEITLLTSNRPTNRTLAEGIIAMMETVGIRVLLDAVDDNQFDARRDAGGFDWMIRRGEREFNTVLQNAPRLAPIGPLTSYFHRAGASGELELMDFEAELVDLINRLISSTDMVERREIMADYQRISTENVYEVGLTNYPGALIVNKRWRNVTEGTPILAFQWAEDGAMRERMFVPADLQGDYELAPGVLPHIEN